MTVEHQLDKFDPIDLKQMDRVKLLQRTDTKYLLSKARLLDLLPNLFEHYYALEIKGKKTSVYHTLYLDTAEKKYFMQHHQGRYKRHKVRFRTYIETGISFLEVKLKQKGITNKKRITTTIQEGLDQNQISFLKQWIPENIEDLSPSLQNTFNRITLVHKTDQERVTIDFNLNFTRNDKKVILTEPVIIELKQSKFNRKSIISKLLRTNLIRPQQMSKYCVGCILLNKSLKYNRFKTRLLELNKIQQLWNS
tara:strand:- start:188 stop:940 length:753 start_codon:yes stop_codon:yes gene_type:complete